MRQVTQRLRNGRIELTEVPFPELGDHGVIVDVRASLLSVGTERTKVETARSNLLQKARKRPDDVRKVMDKARNEGLARTVRAVRARLDEPSPLGYSSSGVVLAVGSKVPDLSPGDRVACGGDGHAVHADVAEIPGQLCVPIPDDLPFVQAAFTTVGSIAMQGVRQADVRLGERVAVIGLGLVGQLTSQILRASGCVVTGIDVNPGLVRKAVESNGVDHGFERSSIGEVIPSDLAEMDAVVITAATTERDPIELAAKISRDRGRVVIVGAVSLDIPREPYYRKELELRLSRSYGPGRYDTDYEERGLDYPIGYVRWTERRNMAEFVRLVAGGEVDLDPLITRTVPVEQAAEVFDALVASSESPIGVALVYEPSELPPRQAGPSGSTPKVGLDQTSVGLIGAGNFAQQIIAPGLESAGFSLTKVASARGLTAVGTAERTGAQPCDVESLIDDPSVGTIAIATRHSSHSDLAVKALRAGKAVFVEKPPAIDREGLDAISQTRENTGLPVFVGFNRRHAPMMAAAREHIGQGPIEAVFRVNSPLAFGEHWLDDPVDGGGRLVGEGCHFIDLACWLMGGLPQQVTAVSKPDAGEPASLSRRFAVTLGFQDGSIAQILYGTEAAGSLGKERYELSAGGRTAIINDFDSMDLHASGKTRRVKARVKDKGHQAQFKAMRQAIDGTQAPAFALDPLATMAVTFDAADAAAGRASGPRSPE